MTTEISQTRSVWFQVDDDFRRGTTLEDWLNSIVPSGRPLLAEGQTLRVWLISGCPCRDDSALGKDLRTAQAAAYAAVECIQFECAHFRRDIAAKAFLRQLLAFELPNFSYAVESTTSLSVVLPKSNTFIKRPPPH